MKALKYTVLIAALASGLVLTAKADLILSPFGDIPKNGTGIFSEQAQATPVTSDIKV
jgi:hypothetical protein